jgi:hypothetical protein
MKGKQAVAFLNQIGRRDSDLATLYDRGATSAKDFCSLVAGRFQRRAKRSKSFLVLFFKKELLSSSRLPLA